MSIRLRFTLLYTFILALTLTLFGLALYTIQSQDTLTSLKQDLIVGANRLADATLKMSDGQTFSDPPPDDGHGPLPFDEFSNDQTFQAFPEREIARVLDPQGNLVASPFGREEDALPLSEEGLLALQSQQDWWETDTVSDAKMLIYSRPVIEDSEIVYIVQVARPLTEETAPFSHSLPLY